MNGVFTLSLHSTGLTFFYSTDGSITVHLFARKYKFQMKNGRVQEVPENFRHCQLYD